MQNIQNDLLRGVDNVSISFSDIIPKIPVAIVGVIVGYLIIKLLARFMSVAFRWTNWPVGLQEILTTLTRAAMWVFLLIIILQILGLTSIALALTGSLAILLLGFSQGISAAVSDLMAGLQLSNDKDFKVGFKVKAGDQKTEGIVREMDIKKTRIEGSDGRLHVIPNSMIEKNEWVVLDRHVHSKMPSTTSAIINKASSIKSRVSSVKKKG